MIIIQTEGGLGNQMFQYALAISFQQRGISAKLDISKYEEQHGHNGYELERVFNVDAQYCSKTEREIVKRISKLNHILFNSPYKEKEAWQYHEAVSKLRFGFLKGYWQTEKYFAAAEKKVREAFTFAPLTEGQNKEMQEKIINSNAVSIHIRRGDYLNADINCSLGFPYYQQAIAYINKTISNPSYFIFSDDIEWAKENIKEKQTAFIGWNKGSDSYIDMQLMSQCRHNIIANSSFSWWGAWLNNHADKIVIAPSPWMPSHTSAKDIIPAGWVQLPAVFA